MDARWRHTSIKVAHDHAIEEFSDIEKDTKRNPEKKRSEQQELDLPAPSDDITSMLDSSRAHAFLTAAVVTAEKYPAASSSAALVWFMMHVGSAVRTFFVLRNFRTVVNKRKDDLQLIVKELDYLDEINITELKKRLKEVMEHWETMPTETLTLKIEVFTNLLQSTLEKLEDIRKTLDEIRVNAEVQLEELTKEGTPLGSLAVIPLLVAGYFGLGPLVAGSSLLYWLTATGATATISIATARYLNSEKYRRLKDDIAEHMRRIDSIKRVLRGWVRDMQRYIILVMRHRKDLTKTQNDKLAEVYQKLAEDI